MRDKTSEYLVSVPLLFGFLCLWHLVHYFPNSNEISKFIDAMSVIDPDWVPGLAGKDNVFVGRQQLFHFLLSPALQLGGFYWATLIGRILSFLLLSFGFSLIGVNLSLRPALLLLALALFVDNQSLVAREWIVLGVEPKVLSYGFSFLALGLLLSRTYSLYLIAFLLGVSVSFHPLVGGYMTLAILVAAVCTSFVRYQVKSTLIALGAFFIGAAFAVKPVFGYLLKMFSSSSNTHELPTSALYVFLRTPHHLDPYSWQQGWWYYALGCLVAIGCMSFLLLKKFRTTLTLEYRRRITFLLIFTLVTILPFAFGLIVRPYDENGTFLQFYLFRTADVIVPLVTYLLCACCLELLLQRLPNWTRFCPRIVALTVLICLIPTFYKDAKLLGQFPRGQRYVNGSWYELCEWVKENTERDALFLTNPKGSEAFPWLARRRIYGTFKQVPLSGGLREWKERMKLLSNVQEPFEMAGFDLSGEMSNQYRKHSVEYVQKLFSKTGAKYFVTDASHKLPLPIVFQNKRYIIYSKREVLDSVRVEGDIVA